MAPKMRLCGLSPAIWNGLRSSTRTYFVAAGHASRSTHESTSSDHVLLAFGGKASKTELPGLYRRDLKLESPRDCLQARTLSVFTSDLITTPSEYLQEQFAGCVQKPNGNGTLSDLRYSHGLANAALSELPSTRHVLVRQSSGSKSFSGKQALRGWALRCVLSRGDSQSNMENVSSFSLRIQTGTADIYKVGPCNNFPETSPILRLTIELNLEPKALLSFDPPDKPVNELTQDMDDIASNILTDLRQSLHGREFTSGCSWNEAVVMHLKDSFRHSALEQYFELESIRVIGDRYPRGQQSIRWVHGIPPFNVAPYSGDLGALFLPRLMKHHEEVNPGDEQSRAASKAHTDSGKRENIKVVIHPYTLDVSVASVSRMEPTLAAIAQRLEDVPTQTIAKDLPSLLDSFLAIARTLPTNVTDSLAVKVLHDTSSRFMELRQSTSSESVDVSFHIDLHRSFQLRFNSSEWKPRPIRVERILFQLSPIDSIAVNSPLESIAKDQVGIEQEGDHLIENASKIISTVCDGVKFDDVATIPGMLAEAVLRIVRPSTAGFKLERVSVDVIIGDDPVTLTKTMSMADLVARVRTPECNIPPLDSVGFPSGYQSTVSRYGKYEEPLEDDAEKTGFKYQRMQLLSHPPADYAPISAYLRLVDRFKQSLEASQESDLLALQAIVHSVLEEVAPEDEAVLQLSGHSVPYPAPFSTSTARKCQIAVFSDGDVICVLDPLTHMLLRHEGLRECEPTPAMVQIWIRGAPGRQANERVNARQQMALMREVLASKLSAGFDDIVFRNLQDSADKIAGVIFEARSELEEHIVINALSVDVSLYSSDKTPTGLAQQDVVTTVLNGSRQNEAERKLHSLVADIDRPAVDLAGMTKSRKYSNGKDGADQDMDVHVTSANDLECEHTVAIKKLLRELDSKLLSITSTSSKATAASDKAMRSVQLAANEQRGNKMQRGVVVALGSNIGNRIEEIEKACRAIDADPDMRIVDTSFLYETKPMYVEDQGHFVNGACEIETSLTPIQLLDRLQAIEQGHGRVKLVDKGPRNIDLDIAIFRDEVVDSERLTIPHMLMHEREFVMRPIMDLEKMRTWINPRTIIPLGITFNSLTKPKSREQSSGNPMHSVTPLTADTIINASNRLRKTLVMSILNTTPDSFSDGKTNTLDPQSLRETAAAHIAAGATIIDVGGQSSRPNAPDVTAEEEINRVLPAIAAIKSLPESDRVAISVDTYRAVVAEAAINAGAHIVNDISAGMMDPQMLATVARLGCTYIMMHMRGTPATMQNPENCVYENGVRKDVLKELHARTQHAAAAGVRRWRMILDPGIGFAKTQDHNLDLLQRPFKSFRINPGGAGRSVMHMPTLYGCSRKSFIGNITGVSEPKDRIWGTAAAVTASIWCKADIVRVHDVEEMAQVAKMADAVYRAESYVF